MIFRCTQKALKEFGLPINVPYPIEEGLTQTADTWYVNLFRYARRKSLIFTNEQTLYAVIIVGVTKRDMERLRALFRWHAERQMRADGIAADAIRTFLSEMGPIVYAKTESRRVLGSMNDQVRVFKGHCDWRGGAGVCDFEYENKLINDMPMHRGEQRDVIWPLPEMQEKLGSI